MTVNVEQFEGKVRAFGGSDVNDGAWDSAAVLFFSQRCPWPVSPVWPVCTCCCEMKIEPSAELLLSALAESLAVAPVRGPSII